MLNMHYWTNIKQTLEQSTSSIKEHIGRDGHKLNREAIIFTNFAQFIIHELKFVPGLQSWISMNF